MGEPGVCSWTSNSEIMTQERLWQVLDPSWGDIRALSALLCSSAAAVVLLKWLGRRQVQQRMDEARRTRHLALERMEKAAHRLKQEVNVGYVQGRDYNLDNQSHRGALINPSVNGGWGSGVFCESHRPPLPQKGLPQKTVQIISQYRPSEEILRMKEKFELGTLSIRSPPQTFHAHSPHPALLPSLSSPIPFPLSLHKDLSAPLSLNPSNICTSVTQSHFLLPMLR